MEPEPVKKSRRPTSGRLAAFGLGFLALSWQILLMREFVVHFYGNEVVVGILLGSWLLWFGLGSLSAPRLRAPERVVPYLFILILLAFPLCMGILRFSRLLLGLLPGEISGLAPAALFGLLLTALICFPMGWQFVFVTRAAGGSLDRVYLYEALGSAVAGVVLYFLLIPYISNWQAAATIGILAAGALGWRGLLTKRLPVLVGICFLLAAFGLVDFPTQKLFWKPFRLVGSKDSPYGKLQMLSTAEQLTLYCNSAPVFSLPDPAAAEEVVHFTLLQHPRAHHVLLIGGGLGGGLKELLKYPLQRIDYVESDPDIIPFARSFLPSAELQALDSDRVHIHHSDGRVFLRQTETSYDVILLNLPDPATAQLNRFFTREFFTLAAEKLTPDGLLSFRLSSAENYISPELQDFLVSMYATLQTVFPVVEVVPGGNGIFLGSARSLTLDPRELGRRIENLDLDNDYITPALLAVRLDPLRRRTLSAALKTEGRLNRDLYPISYLFSAVLWSTQFRGAEARLFTLLARLDPRWLLSLPVGIFALLLLYLAVRGRSPIFYLVPLTVMGWTTIVCEVVVIFAYQILHGSLYHRLALLFSSFMLGLTLGAWIGIRSPFRRYGFLLFLQALQSLLIFLLFLAIRFQPSLLVFTAFLWLSGALAGDLFITANRLYLTEHRHYGLGYGLDLLGSFLGALVTSSLLIPIVGLLPLTGALVLANIFCLAFLGWGWKRV